MDYFSVTYPPSATLGMSVIARDDHSLPELGNTLVESVDPTGLSRQGGVEPGDFILSVNEQYIAFESNQDVVSILKTAIMSNKPLSVYFVRPNPFDWQQIQRSSETPVKEGMIQKLHSGLFKKWNTRNLKVTRTTLDYSSDGVLKGKFALEKVGAPKVSAGYTHQQGVFEFKCSDKDFVVQTNSTHERNLWMHAIDCARRQIFSKTLAGSSQATSSSSRPMQQQPNQSTPDRDGLETYLNMGRAALLKQSQDTGGGSNRQHKVTEADSSAIYKILSLSRVQAASGPDNVVSLKDIKDPTTFTLALVDYDFRLEKSVLEGASA